MAISVLQDSQVQTWETQGFLKIPAFFSDAEVQIIQQEVKAIETSANTKGKYLHHFELIGEDRKLSRSENFVPFHLPLKNFLTEGKLLEVISTLIKEPAVLYKEKINYKYPDGGGYAPHQDATAYHDIQQHISCLISVDPTTIENGCLELVAGRHKEGFIDTDNKGLIAKESAQKMKFEAVETAPGDILLFHSFTPHRSGINKSDKARRAIYATYNARAEGDLRAAYYQKKIERLKQFEKEGGEKARRISLIGHFQGKTIK